MHVGSLEQSRLARTAALALIPVGCLVLYADDPADGGVLPVCPFRAVTGLDCPGCGTARAMHQLTHGRVVEAFDLNPLALLTLPVFAYALVSFVASTWGRSLPRVRVPAWGGWTVAAVVFAYWIARNLPWTPFAWMGSSA